MDKDRVQNLNSWIYFHAYKLKKKQTKPFVIVQCIDPLDTTVTYKEFV